MPEWNIFITIENKGLSDQQVLFNIIWLGKNSPYAVVSSLSFNQ